MLNKTTTVWKLTLARLIDEYDYISSPRGMKIREEIAGRYSVRMPAYIDLKDRKVNVAFMLAEAAWIVVGSNRLSKLTPYMKAYANYSDDGVFLRGAYGPKVVDQLGYIVDTLEKDQQSRQALLNIWRERPGEAKDIPCTVSMQFFIRENKLEMVTTMRSHDIVMGFTYDVFTFSMVAKAVQLLLRAQGVEVDLGLLTVTAGSLHIYEKHVEDAKNWIKSTEVDEEIDSIVDTVNNANTYEELIEVLETLAMEVKEIKSA